jgi:hypothetical protein
MILEVQRHDIGLPQFVLIPLKVSKFNLVSLQCGTTAFTALKERKIPVTTFGNISLCPSCIFPHTYF